MTILFRVATFMRGLCCLSDPECGDLLRSEASVELIRYGNSFADGKVVAAGISSDNGKHLATNFFRFCEEKLSYSTPNDRTRHSEPAEDRIRSRHEREGDRWDTG